MQRNTLVRTTIAAGVAGLGLSVGGIALATADDDSGSSSRPGWHAFDGDRPHGPGLHVRFGPGGDLVETLAESLGVSEEEVETALEAVHDELAPEPPAEGEEPTPPTEEEMEERQQAFADALAAELDVPASEVTAVLAELRADHETEARSMLADRLTAAVEAGDLTNADKASVLKAFDAGVLDGPMGGPMGGHGFGGPGR